MNWIGQRSESEAAPGETLLDRGPRLLGKIGDPRPRRRETREAPPAPALRALDLAQPDSLAEALAHDRAELAERVDEADLHRAPAAEHLALEDLGHVRGELGAAALRHQALEGLVQVALQPL